MTTADQYTDDMLPWPKREPVDKRYAHYSDTQSPPEEMEFKLGAHLIRVVPGVGEGIMTGRGRTRIECLTCRVLVHKGTTGARIMVLEHLNRPGGGYERPL